jgi:hypothetical protein
MKNESRLAPALTLAVLGIVSSACTPDASAPHTTTTQGTPATSAETAPAPVTHADAAPAAPAMPSATDAVAVVRDYYAAINTRDFAAAYAHWDADGMASGQDFAHFRDGYAETESVEAVVGEAYDLEGAAGSRYIRVPVELESRQRDGSERRYRGSFALRAAVADGASAQQRRWHLHSAEMRRLPD